jgi:hypothetical protein
VSDALRRAGGFCWRLPPPRLHVLDPRTRPAPRLAHGIQHAARVRQLRPSLASGRTASDWLPHLKLCELRHIFAAIAVTDGRRRTGTDVCGQCRPRPGMRAVLRAADSGYTLDAGADITLPKVPG